MLYEIMEPNFQNIDKRGGLVQLVRDGYSQVNFIYSKAGSVRGGHYHHRNTEVFYVVRGSFDLVLEHYSGKETYKFQAGDMFKVFPEVKHTFYYSEDTELISLYNYGVELSDGEMDIYQ